MKFSSEKKSTNFYTKCITFFKNLENRIISDPKRKIAYNLFWGRSSLYKKIIHICIFTITSIGLITGISSSYLQAQNINRSLLISTVNNGNLDLLEQGGSVETVLATSITDNFTVYEYKLKKNDKIANIARKYRISKRSLLLSNIDIVYFHDESFKPGDILKIPNINGILVKTEENDNLNKLMDRITKGKRLDIIEINGLKGPDYKLPKKSFVLVPDGDMETPPKRIPDVNYVNPVFANVPRPTPSQAVLNGVHFVDPMFRCPYSWGRGYTGPQLPAHNGVDLLAAYGCPISAAASGTVTKTGFTTLEGFQVTINHGNGVETLYWHGNGNIYVRTGQTVAAGDPIMEVGSTGLAYGNHLHLCLRLNFQYIDPAPYIPYYRP